MRERCQFDSVSSAVSRWQDPSNRLCLVLDRLAEVPLSSASAMKVFNLVDSNLYQCKRKLGDGHFTSCQKGSIFVLCCTLFLGNPSISRI